MRWRGRERSDNVTDHRGGVPRAALGGGGGLLVVIVVLIVKMMGGGQQAQNLAGGLARQVQQQRAPADPGGGAGIEDDNREFIEVVLNDTEEIWTDLFERQVQGGGYRRPMLNIFTSRINTACGTGQAAMGPFYCPADQEIYIDPTFFDDLATRHSAPGDFAQAYVIAHEVAHHVQNLLGWNKPVQQARASGDEILSNQMSVRLELQADFLAGVWAHHAHKEFDILEAGDMEEAIQAANQIGDDTLQRQATGTVVPERFTHGTSAQRVRWFKEGLRSGDLTKAELLFQLDYRRL
ncbi:MAG: neutral zinc metallopeptidase [Planctomycetaceae bacterium]|nr:neutral zinc metallopeptidase [Planctomycetaceae bacterium]